MNVVTAHASTYWLVMYFVSEIGQRSSRRLIRSSRALFGLTIFLYMVKCCVYLYRVVRVLSLGTSIFRTSSHNENVFCHITANVETLIKFLMLVTFKVVDI
jgi:hypothetical protein